MDEADLPRIPEEHLKLIRQRLTEKEIGNITRIFKWRKDDSERYGPFPDPQWKEMLVINHTKGFLKIPLKKW